ncbi:MULTISPECIES: MFS transporter [unclassified Chelatococcus]|uniref:MFS transporter n=1 Tax=unclassified Chelatococcus TaxID=2638111 RepID=UPI001BCFB63B|nr:MULTISPECIES: MFS transporter [unclassified Chelatococcus]CAH1672823.1 Inner membrane transport protein YdhP [Hyphomicrobiales bacterium]MBS7738902.1 MFS transporter [Chelatococcus sp. HY11]MBX3547054.1 MFS transporter [Chelatococcus sp.]MCO5076569.1 MFS transporter [Chelatococcus sp.]CAH1674939.1 Inner membrane transport protein YdhP [Hyphomicrobiales bacterium]
MPAALWALAIAAFGIGTTEFVIAGLLPNVAMEFAISIPMAGNMATSYALGVFVGAPVTIILGARLPRKAMLAWLLVLFIIGNLVTAMAPSYPIALLGRVITSLTHGAFFGIGSIMAADLVAPNRRTSAIAFMFTGLTLATLVGAPAGTWLAQAVSWRATFFAITAIGVVALAGVLWLVPHVERHERPHLRKELAAFADIHVLLAMGITILGPAAFFTSITYVAPMMTEMAGFSAGAVTWLLALFGLGLFVGNILGGRLADLALMPLLYTTLAAQAAALLAFYFLVESQVASALCIFLMSAFGFATVAPIQKLVTDNARAAGAPNLASSVNIGLFNLGNAIGAWAGGAVIAVGFGYAAPNWAGALLSLAALILALLSGGLARRGRRSPASTHPAV